MVDKWGFKADDSVPNSNLFEIKNEIKNCFLKSLHDLLLYRCCYVIEYASKSFCQKRF